MTFEDFDVVHEGNHGVFVEIVFGDMLDDVTGEFRGSDNYNLAVARLGVPRTDAAGAFAVSGVAGVACGAFRFDFGQEAGLDGAVTNDYDALHQDGSHLRGSFADAHTLISRRGF